MRWSAVTPLFDKDTNLVGWISQEVEHIFDTGMNWVGYIEGGHVWRSADDMWVGPIVSGNIHDTQGHAIAWSQSSIAARLPPMTPLTPLRPLTPLKPLKPLNPLRPLKPLTPLGGWSDASFEDAFY